MGNLEQALLEDLPFDDIDDVEDCSSNCHEIETWVDLVTQKNELLIKKNDTILEKNLIIVELRDLLEDLMNENQGLREASDRMSEYISNYELAVRQFNNKNAN